MGKFTDSSNDFALKLFKEVANDENNSFLSLASIMMALAMAYAGAGGLDNGQINESLNEVVKAINEPTDAYVLRNAYRLYIENSYNVLESYLNVVRKNFHSDCISCDFKEKSQEVRQEINTWMEKTTNDKIKDQPANAIDMEPRLVLVNVSVQFQVQLPKFKLEQSFDLVQKLKKLGMSDMSTNAADFSKMTGSKDLMVTDIVHKVFIEVNEKGSEAAAAISRGHWAARGFHKRHQFIADYPFLFATVECKTNSILFLGHYYA